MLRHARRTAANLRIDVALFELAKIKTKKLRGTINTALFRKDKPIPAALGITLDEATRVAMAARAKAEEIGVMMNIAVLDEGNNLTAFARMDGAWQGSIDIAINKAYTARAFDMPTADLGKIAQPGEMCYGIHASNDLRIIANR